LKSGALQSVDLEGAPVKVQMANHFTVSGLILAPLNVLVFPNGKGKGDLIKDISQSRAPCCQLVIA
jgi:hypothetical protein